MAIGIPYISYHMLIDALQPFKVLSEPIRHPKRFRWVSSMHWERGLVSESDMVFVCRAKTAQQLSVMHPGTLLIIIIKQENTADVAFLKNPTILVEDNTTAAGLLQKLQNYFLSIQSWTSELSNVTTSPEALQHVLNKSSRIVGAPLLLYGESPRPLARALFDISPLCKKYLEREREIVNDIRALNKTTISYHSAKQDLVAEGSVIGRDDASLLLVALFEKDPTPGQRDLIAMLAQSLANKADVQTGKFSPTKYSLSSLLDDLVNKRYVSKGRLSDYALNIGVPLDAEFRLFCFFGKDNAPASDLGNLAQELKAANGGRNATVIHNGRLYVLFHSKGLDNSLSNKLAENQLAPYCDPDKGFVAASQVFDELSNLGFAYQQIQLVAKYKKHIDLAYWFTMSEQENRHLCYTFEEALRFLVVDSDEMNPELRDFSFSHTILDKIIAENASNGGDDARILASYIHYERKATIVAEKLHMHRNTVLYRIGKIENRFGLDFNESWSRNRLMFDYSILYQKLIRNPELFKKITGFDISEL